MLKHGQLGGALSDSVFPTMPHRVTGHLMRSLTLPYSDYDAEAEFDDSLFSLQVEVEAAMHDEALGVAC